VIIVAGLGLIFGIFVTIAEPRTFRDRPRRAARRLFCLAPISLLLSSANAQIFLTADYNFPPQTPSGSLSPGGNSIMLAPVPLGVNYDDTNHYLYVSGTGTPESCPITGGTGTSGQPSGVIIINCSHAHASGWTIQSATAGGKEAQVALGAAGGTLQYPAGTSPMHAQLVIDSSNISVVGVGRDSTVLSADLAVTPVVQFGSATSAASSPVLKDLTVSRAAGSVPSGSIGVFWRWFQYGLQDNIHVTRSDVDEWADYPDTSSTSLGLDSYGAYLDSASTAYLKVSYASEVHFYGGSFGVNGPETPNPAQAVIISGGANDVRFVGMNIIPRTTGAKTPYAVSFLGSNTDAGVFTFTSVRFENFGTAYFQSNSGTPSIGGLQVTHCGFADSSIATFSLDAATQLVAATIVGTTIASSVTLTNPAWVTLSGDLFGGTMAMTGGASSILTITGNTFATDATFSGAWTELSVTGNTFYGATAPNFSSATGQVLYGLNTLDGSLSQAPLQTGIVLNQGSASVASAAPTMTASSNGWKEVFYNAAGAVSAFAHAPFTDYFESSNWYALGSAHPNSDGSTTTPDSASNIAFNVPLGEVRPKTYSFAVLPGTPAAGFFVYCTNCTPASACAAGGAGHMAVSNGTNWTCQ